MAMPQRLDHCPRDPGCTNSSVWRDPDTHELYSLWTKEIISSKKYGPTKYNNEYRPHICTNKTIGEIPTTFYIGEWFNPSTGRTRFIGPARLIRMAMSPPPDKKKSWKFVKLRKIENAPWEEIPVPEEFEMVKP